MKILKHLKVSFFIFIGLQSILLQTAEESKEQDDSIDITAIVNSQTYRPLNEGFDILHEINVNIPTLHDYITNNLIQNSDKETNFGDVIQGAQDFISNQMKEPFSKALYNQMDNLYAHEYKIKPLKDNEFDIIPKRKYYRSYTTPFDFNDIQDPIFQYVMKYKDTFMNSIIKEWIRTDEKRDLTSKYFTIGKEKINFVTIFKNAIEYNCVSVVAFLLDMHINPHINLMQDIPYSSYLVPLESAVYFQRPEIAELLLKHGANINVSINMIYGSSNEPLLTEAAKYDDIAMSKILLQYGANINQRNKFGKTALFIATQRNNKELVDILVTAQADPNTQDNLQNGYEINYFGPCERNSGYHRNVYDDLLAQSLPNFNIDTPTRDIYGQTPLIMATRNNSIDIVRTLISAGANLNIANIFYGTALQVAQRNNYTDIRDTLLQSGAIDYTPAQRNYTDIRDKLFEIGSIRHKSDQLSTDYRYKNLPLPPLDDAYSYDKTDPYIFGNPEPKFNNKRKAESLDDNLDSDFDFSVLGPPVKLPLSRNNNLSCSSILPENSNSNHDGFSSNYNAIFDNGLFAFINNTPLFVVDEPDVYEPDDESNNHDQP